MLSPLYQRQYSMMSKTTTVLITGANRGIGKGLVAAYLARPSFTVIATVRDPSDLSSLSLSSLPKGSNSILIILQINDVSSAEAINRGIEILTTEHNITALDVVIANAGIADMTGSLSSAPSSEIQKYVEVNAYGPFELFKSVVPLLRAGGRSSKFVLISSVLGSLTTMSNIFPASAYGASKALANFMFKWLSVENGDLVIWAQHPGAVATEKAQANFPALKKQGIDVKLQFISVEESAKRIVGIIDGASIEDTHGKFFGPDGEEIPW